MLYRPANSRLLPNLPSVPQWHQGSLGPCELSALLLPALGDITPSFGNCEYCDIDTDVAIASGQYYLLFAKDHSASELYTRISAITDLHPYWATMPLGSVAWSTLIRNSTIVPDRGVHTHCLTLLISTWTLYLVTNMPTASLCKQSEEQLWSPTLSWCSPYHLYQRKSGTLLHPMLCY